MAKIVELHPAPFKDDHEFVVDLARFAEGITTEEAIRKKYRLANEVWTKLGDDDELVRAITDEKTRRIRDGNIKQAHPLARLGVGPGYPPPTGYRAYSPTPPPR